MMKRYAFIWFLMLLTIATAAQTEVGDSWLSGSSVVVPRQGIQSPLRHDSLRLSLPPMPLEIKDMGAQTLNGTRGFTEQTAAGSVAFGLWRGAHMGLYGTSSHLPGLMDTATGALALHQDLGRWHLTGMATANKYWMPWQRQLSTQFGFGGTVGYELSKSVTLHAFGYYYANQLLVGPAMSPYMNSTAYGGYADVRFNNMLGADMGVRRYVNPMNGKWTTEPIVSPYIKIGGSKIELPLGGLLKTLIWGDQDNPMRYQPRPHPINRPVMKRR